MGTECAELPLHRGPYIVIENALRFSCRSSAISATHTGRREGQVHPHDTVSGSCLACGGRALFCRKSLEAGPMLSCAVPPVYLAYAGCGIMVRCPAAGRTSCSQPGAPPLKESWCTAPAPPLRSGRLSSQVGNAVSEEAHFGLRAVKHGS